MKKAYFEIGLFILGLSVVACLSPIMHDCVMGPACVTTSGTMTGGVVNTVLVFLSLAIGLALHDYFSLVNKSSSADFPNSPRWNSLGASSPSVHLFNQVLLL